MKERKILVLTDHMPWGHRSIAKALYDYLATKSSKSFKIYFAEVKAETGLGGELYNWAYRNFPAGNRVAVKLFTIKSIRDISIEYSRKNIPALTRTINKYKPDLIISAYFFHSQALAVMKNDYGFDFELWTVVADPWSVNTLSFVVGAEKHLVYDKKMVTAALDFEIDKKNIAITGWWTRGKMFEVFSESKIKLEKKKLGLRDSVPTIFVGGGSLGTNSMSTLLPILLTVRKPLQVIFNTGKDENAKEMVENFKSIIKSLPLVRNKLNIICLGWIEEMAEVLACCDIVMGKAGPNFLFDVVAARKPFVSITHIGGQEDGNIEIIKEKKLGLVAEDPISMARLVRDFVKRPEHYKNMFKDNLAKEAATNKKSLEKVWNLVQEWAV